MAAEVRHKCVSSLPRHLPEGTPHTGATEDPSRQQCLSVQQQTAGGEQCLGKPSGDAPKGGELGRDEVGHVQDDTGQRRRLIVPKKTQTRTRL